MSNHEPFLHHIFSTYSYKEEWENSMVDLGCTSAWKHNMLFVSFCSDLLWNIRGRVVGQWTLCGIKCNTTFNRLRIGSVSDWSTFHRWQISGTRVWESFHYWLSACSSLDYCSTSPFPPRLRRDFSPKFLYPLKVTPWECLNYLYCLFVKFMSWPVIVISIFAESFPFRRKSSYICFQVQKKNLIAIDILSRLSADLSGLHPFYMVASTLYGFIKGNSWLSILISFYDKGSPSVIRWPAW